MRLMFAEHVQHFIEQHRLLPDAGRVLVGISGGVDSVVLLHVLQQLGYGVEAAHVNYQLRGSASEADEGFVRAMCEAKGVPFHRLRIEANAYVEAQQQSLQEAARNLRYAYFLRLAEEQTITHVAVAHHLDDQAETVLLQLVRGAGPEGLAGMSVSRLLGPESQVRLVRPLLGQQRDDVVAYARKEGLQWREDSSNTDPKYRRNVVRTEILPLLQTYFGDSVVDTIARSADLLRGYVEESLRPALAQHFALAAEERPDGGQLNLAYLETLSDVWRGRLLLEACACWSPSAPRTKAFVDKLKALLGAQVGRRVVLAEGTIWREREHLRWVRKNNLEANECCLLQPTIDLVLPDGTLQMQEIAERPASLMTDSLCTVMMAAEALDWPLTVRRWEAGDRMQPFGMTGTKKVSDLLTDAKVPSHRRERVWVVLSGEEIVWVVGVRMAESVRVRPETQRFVKITFKPHRLTEE